LGLPDPSRLSRAQLWGCVAINQFAFPGLGTLLAGRRAGYAQAAIMIAGFLLVMAFLGWFFVCSARFLAGSTGDEETWRAQYRSFGWAWKTGAVLCAVAWVWALASSIRIVRRTSKSSPPSA
jgi:hypothetical protein